MTTKPPDSIRSYVVDATQQRGHRIPKPVAVPGSLPVGFILDYKHREKALELPSTICLECVHDGSREGVKNLAEFYRPLSATEAEEGRRNISREGWCSVESCGQVLALQPQQAVEAFDWWKAEMLRIDIEMEADEIVIAVQQGAEYIRTAPRDELLAIIERATGLARLIRQAAGRG